jgi:hypothetical protein
VLKGSARCAVSVSVDQGATWHDAGAFRDGLDLTDFVKGRRQFFIRFGTNARELAHSNLTMITVCQANSSVLPRLKDDGCRVNFAAFQQGIVSAGPNLTQAAPHVVEGRFGTPRVTLGLRTPRGEPATSIFAVAHINSSNPPDPGVKYQIEYSIDAGTTWRSLVRDWSITRRGDEPGDFWSQSFCWGSAEIPDANSTVGLVRFSNNGGKNYARCEVHLTYRTAGADATRVTFAWEDATGPHDASHTFGTASATANEPDRWDIPTGSKVRTRWVELEVIAGSK